jgi:hypothetical protein
MIKFFLNFFNDIAFYTDLTRIANDGDMETVRRLILERNSVI